MRSWRFRARFVLILLALALLVYAGSMTYTGVRSENLARTIVDRCQDEGDRPACYEREVPALYPQRSVEELFDTIRTVRTLDSSYQFCHVAAHKLGEKVVAEDPDAWVDAIALNPADGLCSNGFIHGVVGGRFRAEVLDEKTMTSLMPDFRRACEARSDWQPSSLDRAICYHGMGHLFLFISDGNIDRALATCESATDANYRRVCAQGVFMQIYQPLEPDDFALIERLKVKPTKENVRQLCVAYSRNPLYEGACLQESWPLFREGILSGKGVASFCSGYPTEEEETQCFVTASAIIGRMSLGKSEQATSACSSLSEERRLICFSNAAQAYLEEDRSDASAAIRLCESSGAGTDACLRVLIDRANFVFGSNTQAYEAFCEALPTRLKNTCARQ